MAASAPGQSRDSNICLPISENPAQLGEPCEFMDNTAGHDNCDIWLTCVANKRGEATGVCIAQCQGSSATPECPDGTLCNIANGGVLAVCEELCDPLMKDCSYGACYSSAEGFTCFAEGDLTYGQPCAATNACVSGLKCSDAINVPGCNATTCCTHYCDRNEANNCPQSAEGQSCIAEGQAMLMPGQENIGICGVMP
jgi:hypothetical protein